MSCMKSRIMIQAVIKSFERSTDKRIEENSNDAFRCYLYSIVNKYFKDEHGHGKMIRTNS